MPIRKYLLFIILINPVFSQNKYTISGYIKDAETGEALIGANVLIKELKTGTAANVYGFYSITLNQGNYTLQFSFLGYKNILKKIELNKDIKLDIELQNSSQTLQTVEITDKKPNENVESVQMSTVKLPIKEVVKVPALMGEIDILKTIQLLPGIQAGGEGTSGFTVRGGNYDQNLILLDEAPVYNASHLFGFFSVFNHDAINDLTIYKGGIPARYGGRLSSLLDIRMKEGNNKHFSVKGGIGSLSSRLTIEGPIFKNKASFMIAGRRNYADIFTQFAKDDIVKNSKLYFYDLNTKVNYTINQNNRIYLSGYFGRDVFKFSDQFLMNWGNATTTLRWNHLFNKRMFSNLTLIYSNFDYNVGVPEGVQSFIWKSQIVDYALKYDFSYYLNPKNTIRFGLFSTFHTFRPAKVEGRNESFITTIELDPNYALEHAIYLSNEQKINEKLDLHYGLRLSAFQNLGKANLYIYDKSNYLEYKVIDTIKYASGEIYNTYTGFEPRLSLRYMFNEKQSLKISYNRTRQYIQLASNSTSASPIDVWFPSSPNVKPQIADQIAGGYFRNLFDNNIESSVEIYYKYLSNTIDFRDHARLIFNKFLEGELRTGKGQSYGLELMLKKEKGILHGWISYTLSKTTRTIAEINNGKQYLAPFDRTHDFSIIAIYDLKERFHFGLTWVYSTGRPITVPSGKFLYQGVFIPVYTDRNAERMPAYHRLDLSFTLDGKVRKRFGINVSDQWVFSIYNVYRRKNAFTINFRRSESDPSKTEAYMIYFFDIVPSITYNFKF